jgi:hypothetical protein
LSSAPARKPRRVYQPFCADEGQIPESGRNQRVPALGLFRADICHRHKILHEERIPAERLYRDARVTKIYEGSNDIQHMIICREISRG